jgi:hypothetical protein
MGSAEARGKLWGPGDRPGVTSPLPPGPRIRKILILRHPPTGGTAMTVEDTSAAGTAYWFLDTLAVVHSAMPPLVIEVTVPPGGSPPLHVHDDLDDSSYLLDGRLAVRCGERSFRCDPGAYLPQPRGVPHTFRVLGSRPARMLLIHGDDSFLRLVHSLGIPAPSRTLPSGMAPVALQTLERAFAEVGVSVVGPSMTAQEADTIAAASAMPGIAELR